MALPPSVTVTTEARFFVAVSRGACTHQAGSHQGVVGGGGAWADTGLDTDGSEDPPIRVHDRCTDMALIPVLRDEHVDGTGVGSAGVGRDHERHMPPSKLGLLLLDPHAHSVDVPVIRPARPVDDEIRVVHERCEHGFAPREAAVRRAEEVGDHV